MNLHYNLVFIICALIITIVTAIAVRFIFRSYYAEKRRHISIMMRGESGSNESNYSDHATKDSTVTWKEKKEN